MSSPSTRIESQLASARSASRYHFDQSFRKSYFDKATGAPYYFVRKIDEGGHTKNLRIKFNHELGQAYINDLKRKKDTVVSVDEQVQDMVSAYYFLRSNYNKDMIEEGDVVSLNMFFDEENYKFKLKFLGKETINTTFGKIKTLKFRPYVMAGRVFKEEESLTLWVSEDDFFFVNFKFC